MKDFALYVLSDDPDKTAGVGVNCHICGAGRWRT